MNVPVPIWVAAALGLTLSYPGFSQAAAPAPPPLLPCQGTEASETAVARNQVMAQKIADLLHESRLLKDYDIDVHFHEGTADLRGTVKDPAQREQAIRLSRSVPGVERVEDRLQVAGTILRVQAEGLERLQPLPPGPAQPLPPAGPVQAPPGGAPLPPAIDSNNPPPGAGMPPPAPGAGQPGSITPLPTGPAASTLPPGASAPAQGYPEAMPSFQAPAPHPLNPPKMPPYAWPTYAPYNNFSRVAYPDSYPYQAFPYIGPIYPFPKIPPGWRSVKLEWEDGYWYFSKHATKWDWWRLRYY